MKSMKHYVALLTATVMLTPTAFAAEVGIASGAPTGTN